MTADDRYPDEWFLTDFERRLADGRLLERKECEALIAELRRHRQERSAIDAGLAGLQITIAQHQNDPRPDEWYYEIGGLDGGPAQSRNEALRMALAHWTNHCQEIRQENEALYTDLAALRGQVDHLQQQLDQADGGDGLEPWRRALEG